LRTRTNVPGREEAVSIWDSETMILRLIAVLFVVALLRICGKGKDTGRETVLYLTVVTASATVNLLRSGGGGFLMTAIGAIAAFAISAPLITRDRSQLREIAAPVATGSLLGPLGGLIAIAIATVLYLMQRSRGCRSMVTDIFPRPISVPREESLSPRSSVLTLIENRRLGRKTDRDRGASCLTEDRYVAEESDTSVESNSWRISLAVATLAVLMTGVFV
jgi:hypothetical protein